MSLCHSVQIHKQAPPLEDISEDCSPAMRGLLERALERVPTRRSSATELLHEEALHPSREDQPRCWSLDSALGDSTHPLLRQHSQMTDSTQGKHTKTCTCTSCQSSHLHSFTLFLLFQTLRHCTLKILARLKEKVPSTQTSARWLAITTLSGGHQVQSMARGILRSF